VSPAQSTFTAPRLGLAAEEILQEGMLGGGEGIGYGDGVPGEAGLEVFGEEEAAAGFGGGSEDHAIPEAEAMADGEFGSSEEHGQRGFRDGEDVTPREDGGAGLRGDQLTLADKNLEEFGDDLRGKDNGASGQGPDQGESHFLHGVAIHALRVGEEVRVQRDSHSASS
jgi:hypothetical protein